MEHESEYALYMELLSLEDRGITIWLEECPDTSRSVASRLCAHEESTYMRDYIFDDDKGVLKELHFDKLNRL